VLLKEGRTLEFQVEKAIPLDCILGVEQMKEHRFMVTGTVLDKYCSHTNETVSLDIKAPRGKKGEIKAELRRSFQSIMNQCMDVIEEIRSSVSDPQQPRDYLYLEKLPESLTQNAILDLNTILRDRPVHDELVHEATKFLGDEPFLLEESLRDGNDRENGVLFAAGKQGYYWIQGKKQGRFMSNVIVDTVEWENLRGFVHQWHRESAIIYATYSLTKGGNESTREYLWSPSTNRDTHEYPWLLQELNGSWILTDILHKYSEIPS
jgi:hypothetical protein